MGKLKLNSSYHALFKSMATSFLLILLVKSSSYAQSFGPFAQLKEVIHICGDESGAIEFELLGNPDDYQYYGWPGRRGNMLRIEDLETGVYTFVVQNKFGCTESYDVEIVMLDNCSVGYRLDYFSNCEVRIELYLQNGNERLNDQGFDIVWADGEPVGFNRVFRDFSATNLCFQITPKGGNEACCTIDECVFLDLKPCTVVVDGPKRCELIINEFGGRGLNQRQYVELLVLAEDECNCDLQSYILDDNNGELIQGNHLLTDNTKDQIGIDMGYIQFQNTVNWSSIPSGSLILIYDEQDDLYTEIPDYDPVDSNGDQLYVLAANDTRYFTAKQGEWNYNERIMEYNGLHTIPSWNHIRLTSDIDGMQIRYPDGSFCHGIGHGSNAFTTGSAAYLWFSNGAIPDCNCGLKGNDYTIRNSYSCRDLVGTPGNFNADGNEDMIRAIRELCPIIPTGSLARQANPVLVNQVNSVYPNPFKDKININFYSAVAGTTTARIYTLSGTEIYKTTFKTDQGNNSQSIDLKDALGIGVYLLEFNFPSGEQQFIKIVAMH